MWAHRSDIKPCANQGQIKGYVSLILVQLVVVCLLRHRASRAAGLPVPCANLALLAVAAAPFSKQTEYVPAVQNFIGCRILSVAHTAIADPGSTGSRYNVQPCAHTPLKSQPYALPSPHVDVPSPKKSMHRVPCTLSAYVQSAACICVQVWGSNKHKQTGQLPWLCGCVQRTRSLCTTCCRQPPQASP